MRDRVLKYCKTDGDYLTFKKVLFFACGFVLSFAKISGIMSPFCLSFAMALKKKYSIFCFLGGICSIVLFLKAQNIVYLFILMLALSLKIMFKSKSACKNAILCSISFIVPNIFFMLFNPTNFSGLLLIYFQVILYALITALCTQNSKNFNFKFEVYGFLQLFIVVVAFLVSFSNITFARFNFGRFVANLVMIEIFSVYGFNFASAFGTAATISFSLFSKEFAKFGVITAISGFLAGFFINTNKFFQNLIFIFTYCFCCFFFGGFGIESFLEVLIAVFVSFIIPKQYINKILNLKKEEKAVEKVNLNDKISSNLKFAASMLLDLENNIKNCAKAMDSLNSKKINSVYDEVAQAVCKDCGLNTFCWVTSFNELTRAFSQACYFLRKNGSINQNNLPIFLKKKCCKLQTLVQYLNFSYKEYVCIEQNHRRVNEARDIAAEQFLGMSEFLMELSDDIKTIRNINFKSSSKIKTELIDRNFKVKNLFCFVDEFDREIVDVYVPLILKDEELKKISLIVCSELKKNMSHSSFIKAGDCYKISFFEKTDLCLDFSAKQISANNNSCCGDSYEFFVDGKGFAHIILSDGMGNGKRAFLDSLMTCLTLRKFIETGFGFNSALKLLNLSFAIKSREESLATIDNLTIDLYTGDASFKKAGATSSYVVCKGELKKISSKSLPIGIIRGISFDRASLIFEKGDVIVMVSDGATSSGMDWILSELKQIYKNDAEQIAKHILNVAKQREDEKHSDDITVIAIKVV